jgi:hypothetical protein
VLVHQPQQQHNGCGKQQANRLKELQVVENVTQLANRSPQQGYSAGINPAGTKSAGGKFAGKNQLAKKTAGGKHEYRSLPARLQRVLVHQPQQHHVKHHNGCSKQHASSGKGRPTGEAFATAQVLSWRQISWRITTSQATQSDL